MFKKLNDEDSPNKQEGNAKDTKTTVYPSSSRTWSALRDPRVVRVSRALGGKDRHSKVTTIRGLRDRRVRLSVQTAIQLYDLQDRLGLNQPSKVVDWLLNAAQHEIDKLPPLQIPPEIFLHYPQSDMIHQSVISQQTPIVSNKSSNTRGEKDGQNHSLGLQFGKENPLYSNNIVGNTITVQEYDYWKSRNSLESKLREVPREGNGEKINWNKRKDQENGEADEGQSSQISQSGNTNNRCNPSSFSNMLNNAFPLTPYYQLDTLNASFPHEGHVITTQTEASHNPSSVSVPLPPPSSQLLLYPSSNIPSIFGQNMGNSTEFDPRQVNQFQMLSSTAQNILSNSLTASLYSLHPTTRHFNINSKYDSSQHSNENPSASIPKSNVSPSNPSSTSSFHNNCKDSLGKNPSFM